MSFPDSQTVTKDFLLQNLDHSWNWGEINQRNLLTLDEYLSIRLKNSIFHFITMSWNKREMYNKQVWDFACFIPTLTTTDLSKYPKLSWYDVLSEYNVNIDSLIATFPTKPWNWTLVSRNKHVSQLTVANHRDKPWDLTALSKNPNLPSNIINIFPKN